MEHEGATTGHGPDGGPDGGQGQGRDEDPRNGGSSLPEMREQLIGLGERSMRKSHYPELRRRLDQLERFRALLDEVNDLIILADVDTGGIMDVAGTPASSPSAARTTWSD